jgi:ketosteroid isomerase-like protein
MTIATDFVRNIFKGLQNGDGAAFFAHVADDVDWIVMGTHPWRATTPARRRSSRVRSTNLPGFFRRGRSSMWNT